MQAREFYKHYVIPAVNDWAEQKLSIRHAVIAACEVDNLAEHYIQETQGSLKRHEVGPKRDHLKTLCADTAILRDIHDTHKHGNLERDSSIKNGLKTDIVIVKDIIDIGFDESFDFRYNALFVILDNGDSIKFETMIENALLYWSMTLCHRQ